MRKLQSKRLRKVAKKLHSVEIKNNPRLSKILTEKKVYREVKKQCLRGEI